MSSENGVTLERASSEWASRPDDERFGSVEELHVAASTVHSECREAKGVRMGDLRVGVGDEAGQDGRGLYLVGKHDRPAKLTHWAFGQLCQQVGAPASYLRTLPPTLAAQNLNHGLAKVVGQDQETNVLLREVKDDGVQALCLASNDYTRIWNDEVTARLVLLKHAGLGWQEAPAAFDGSRGQYASDHDMFSFFVDSDRRIFESDPGGGLGRGFFVFNAIVPGFAFYVMTFYYEFVCGNHRVWGAKGVKELRLRHVGNVDERVFQQLEVQLKEYAEGSAQEDELKIKAAREKIIAGTREEVIDTVFALSIGGLSKRKIGEGFDRAEEHEAWYGDPKSVWGLCGGLTELARDLPFGDARVELERAAGKVMEVAF